MKIQVMQGVLNPARFSVENGDCACDSPSSLVENGECGCDSPSQKVVNDHPGIPLPSGASSYSLLSFAMFTPEGDGVTALQPENTAPLYGFAPIKPVPTHSPDPSLPELFPILTPVFDVPCLKTLSAWFHLTDRCNLRCDYCYLPHHPQDMSAATGYSAVQALFRSANQHAYPRVKIMYAGGEPLLRFPLILELHEHARTLANTQKIHLEETVLSNGTLLTVQMIRALKDRNIRLMISVDGMGAWHDSQRRFSDGKGSFDKVSRAVELALAHGIRPNISITVTGRNAAGLAELVVWILERELPFQLNFYRPSVLSQSHTDLQLENETILSGIQSALKVIENNLPRFSLLSILDRTTLAYPHTLPCGAGSDYLVFTPQGEVAQCQMLLRQPVTNVFAADPLSHVRADQTHFRNPPVDERGECAACPWRYWCGGGCPLETRRVMGSPYRRSPNCHLYQTILPELIRLEGLRLLQYVSDPEVVRIQDLEIQPV